RRPGHGDDHVQHWRRHAQLSGHGARLHPGGGSAAVLVHQLHSALINHPVSSIVVRAPATSANLGAGFDCLGLALDLWNEVVALPGQLADDDATNLILRAARATYARVGAAYPGFELRCTNRIVFNRGLGSSAAAIACGVLFANACLNSPLDNPA